MLNLPDNLIVDALARIFGVDHQANGTLHQHGTLTSELTGDDHLATVGTTSMMNRNGTMDNDSSDELVAERFGLSDGGQTTGRVQFNGVERRER